MLKVVVCNVISGIIILENLKYQRGNQKPQVEEGQTIPWPKGQTTIYKTLHMFKVMEIWMAIVYTMP